MNIWTSHYIGSHKNYPLCAQFKTLVSKEIPNDYIDFLFYKDIKVEFFLLVYTHELIDHESLGLVLLNKHGAYIGL